MSVRPCDDVWLSAAEFAAIVGKKVTSIYNEIQRGDDLPPYYKFKQKIRFRKSDVDAWLAKFRRAPRHSGPQDAPSARLQCAN